LARREMKVCSVISGAGAEYTVSVIKGMPSNATVARLAAC